MTGMATQFRSCKKFVDDLVKKVVVKDIVVHLLLIKTFYFHVVNSAFVSTENR